jgi:hypothetical protein
MTDPCLNSNAAVASLYAGRRKDATRSAESGLRSDPVHSPPWLVSNLFALYGFDSNEGRLKTRLNEVIMQYCNEAAVLGK